MERAKQGKITDGGVPHRDAADLALHAQENTTIAEQARQAALDELYGLGYDYRQGFRRSHPGGHA